MALNKELTDLWERYNEIRSSGDKKTANRVLDDFIPKIREEDYATRKDFVDEICEAFLDDEIAANNGEKVSAKKIRIQHPLFKEIVLPILIEEYKNKSAKHTRWIGQFEQFIYSDWKATNAFTKEIGKEDFISTDFFEESFHLEESQKTLDLLLDRLARSLNYCIHEVPFGILAEPDDFEEEINLFKKYHAFSGKKEIWTEKLAELESLAFHWRAYREREDEYAGFVDYLEKNGLDEFL